MASSGDMKVLAGKERETNCINNNNKKKNNKERLA